MKNTKRSKSIFRTEIIIVFGVIVSLILLYVYFFLNLHIKWAAERAAFQSLGAEVNIDSVELDFFKPEIKVNRVQITNPDSPSENILEVRTIMTTFDYSALLYGSFVSELTNIIDIRVNSERARPGRVLPREQRLIKVKNPTQHKIHDELKSQFKKTAFSDLVSLFSKDKRGEIEQKYKESLKSLKLSDQMEKEVDSIKAEVDALEKHLKSPKIKSLLKEVKNFKFSSDSTSASLKSAAAAVKLTNSLKSERNRIKKMAKDIENKVKELKAKAKKSPGQFLADAEGVGSSLSPSNLSSEKITQDVLSQYFSVQLEQMGRVSQSLKEDALGSKTQYVDYTADKVKKVSAASKKVKPEHSQMSLEKKKEELYLKVGRNFVFHEEALPPKFWFKKINITSKSHDGQDFGDINGQILNLSDAPQITRKEIKAQINGSVPKQGIGAFQIDSVVDHVDPSDKEETIKIDVSDYIVKGLELFQGSDEWLKVAKSNSKTTLDVVRNGEIIDLELLQTLRQPDYEVFSKDKYVLQLLNTIKDSGKDLTLKLKAKGQMTDPKIRISSNLGDIILKAVKSNLSSVVNDFVKQQISQLDGVASEKLQPYLKDLDVTNLKATDLSKILDKEIEKGLQKLKSKKGSKKDELLDKLFKKF